MRPVTTGAHNRYAEFASRYRRHLAAASIAPIIAAALLFGGGLGDNGQLAPAVITTGQATLVLSDATSLSSGRSSEPAPAAVASATPAAPASSTQEPADAPTAPFIEYEVAEGDTLSSIAERRGVGLEDILWNNPIAAYDPDTVLVGAQLVVPTAPGIVYYVEIGDTLVDIAARYGIDPEAIVAFEGNNIASADLIVEGEPLLLPGAEPLLQPEAFAEEAPAEDTPSLEPEAPVPVEPIPTPVPEPRPSAPVPASVPEAPPAAGVSVGLIWPVGGPINSYFGPRWGGIHNGIDIGSAAGTTVGAAAAGQVVLTVYSNAGYGNHVIIRHADGSQTLYAHLSAIWVANGQQVGQGEGIGAVGCTGWCTGSHLHFEVRINGVPVDPLLYLP